VLARFGCSNELRKPGPEITTIAAEQLNVSCSCARAGRGSRRASARTANIPRAASSNRLGPASALALGSARRLSD
jgi:hypothetical protein